MGNYICTCGWKLKEDNPLHYSIKCPECEQDAVWHKDSRSPNLPEPPTVFVEEPSPVAEAFLSQSFDNLSWRRTIEVGRYTEVATRNQRIRWCEDVICRMALQTDGKVEKATAFRFCLALNLKENTVREYIEHIEQKNIFRHNRDYFLLTHEEAEKFLNRDKKKLKK
jgi:hypothetical protein